MPSELRRDTIKIGNLLSIAEQIQTFGLGHKTGEIYITSVPPPARINIVKGEVFDAQFGMRSGIEAALALINLPDPQTEFIVGEKPKRRTISMPYMQLLCEAAMARDQESPEKATAPAEAEAVQPAFHVPQLRITLGNDVMIFPLRPGTTSIGRATANDIVISEGTVSQRHARIEFSNDGVFLEDLGSSNGTYLAGQRIKERWLGPEDSLQFGSVACLVIEGTKETIPAA